MLMTEIFISLAHSHDFSFHFVHDHFFLCMLGCIYVCVHVDVHECMFHNMHDLYLNMYIFFYAVCMSLYHFDVLSYLHVLI